MAMYTQLYDRFIYVHVLLEGVFWHSFRQVILKCSRLGYLVHVNILQHIFIENKFGVVHEESHL